jgi:cobalt-zinc-cadmium efflux system outer membrane protein
MPLFHETTFMKHIFSNFARFGLFGVLVLACLCFPPKAGAESRSLSRDGAIQSAFSNNREISIAALEIKRALSKLKWSGRLDNPELEIEATSDEPGNDEDEGSFTVGFTQNFPLTAKLKHERNLRHYQVILAEAEIAERRRELSGKVDAAIVELMTTRAKIEVSNQLVALNKKMVDFLKTQVEQGVVSSLDVMQATLSGRTLEQQSKLLVAEAKQNRLALNKIIGLDPETDLVINSSFSLPGSKPGIDVALQTVLQQRPDYVLSLAKIDETQAAITLEEAKRWEDVSLKLFVEQDDAVDEPEGFDGNTFAGVGISIPLPLRNRNQEGIEQARINHEAASKSVDAARFEIRAECEEAFHQRTDAWRLAREASGEILGLAEKNLEEFRKAYQQGQASLIQVQRAQEQVLELKTGSLELVAEYHRANAAVRLATGSYPGLSVRSGKNPK